MTETIEISVVLPAHPKQVYQTWLTSTGHSAMVNAQADITPQVGARFSMWDGYITGQNIELLPNLRIVQAWRTVDFPKGSPDSRLEINLEDLSGETHLTLIQSSIPDGQGQEYKDGWVENYFEPMTEYFKGIG
jgi:uncharacterized protein YndB with AHSA1/START domain